MITGTGVHDRPESAFTIDWNECSRSTGIGVHDPPERASLAVHDDFQQPSAEHPRCLFAGTFPNDPWAIGDPLFDVFSYVSVDNGRGCYWPEGRAQRLPLANRLVTIRETFPASVWP